MQKDLIQPIFYGPESHTISHEKIDADALSVILRLQSQGYESYLVGGSVRDLLSEQKPKDYDVSTSAKPEDIKRLFGRQCLLIGRRFRLAHVRFGKKTIEVSTFRAQDSQTGELVIEDNLWGSPQEDTLRRDFTINGLLYDPSKQQVIDYVGGLDDLKKGILRTIGDPFYRFREDPVRMIRLIKFHARFNYAIDSETHKALETHKSDILKSSQARVLEELLRMLESTKSEPFFRLMQDQGMLEYIFPALHKALNQPSAEKIYDLLKGADLVQERFGVASLDRPILLACLLFPLFNTELCHDGKKPLPHLGEIMLESHHFLRNMTESSFLHFPKRLTSLTASILMNQYRLTHAKTAHGFSMRALRLKDFPLALKFLKVRTFSDPSLVPFYEQWKALYRQHSHHGDRMPHPHYYRNRVRK